MRVVGEDVPMGAEFPTEIAAQQQLSALMEATAAGRMFLHGEDVVNTRHVLWARVVPIE